MYQWGFNYEWVVIVVSVNAVWLLGMWALWVDADYNSRLCREGRHMGIYRGILDISEAMTEGLGTNLSAYSEKELVTAVRRQPPLKYYVSNVGDGQAAHIRLSSRKSGM